MSLGFEMSLLSALTVLWDVVAVNLSASRRRHPRESYQLRMWECYGHAGHSVQLTHVYNHSPHNRRIGTLTLTKSAWAVEAQAAIRKCCHMYCFSFPTSVTAAIVESWGNGRLKLYFRQVVDLWRRRMYENEELNYEWRQSSSLKLWYPSKIPPMMHPELVREGSLSHISGNNHRKVHVPPRYHCQTPFLIRQRQTRLFPKVPHTAPAFNGMALTVLRNDHAISPLSQWR